ncbi:hypothetical protein BH11MYX1_BH11MYX1_19560 [soil metagenome]
MDREKLQPAILGSYAGIMLIATKRPKLGVSFTTRRLRLGVSHQGTASAWQAPKKEVAEQKPDRKPSRGRS